MLAFIRTDGLERSSLYSPIHYIILGMIVPVTTWMGDCYVLGFAPVPRVQFCSHSTKALRVRRIHVCELVWPGGKAGKQEGPRFESASALFLFESCGLWTLSCDFVPHSYETVKWLSSLPTLMQKSFWW